jgi:membrane-associated phospholipid phosphatase
MEQLIDSGIDLILFLQSLGDWLFPIMQGITYLGNEEFYLLILPILYWCVDASLGLRVGLILMISSSINALFKVMLHSPRPYWVDTRVIAYAAENSFGIPSGHAQNAVAVWGIWAAYIRKSWAWVMAILIILLIGFSRLVLGVHFFVDAIAGWVIGIMVLYFFISLTPVVTHYYRKRELPQQVLTTLELSLLLLLGGAALILFITQTWQIPDEWIANANAAWPDESLNPLSLDSLLTTTGALFGLGVGYSYIQVQGGFQANGTLAQRFLRYIVGLSGVLIFWFGLGEIFPRGADLISYGLRFFRYTLVGLWVTWWAPVLFFRLRIAQRTASASEPPV